MEFRILPAGRLCGARKMRSYFCSFGSRRGTVQRATHKTLYLMLELGQRDAMASHFVVQATHLTHELLTEGSTSQCMGQQWVNGMLQRHTIQIREVSVDVTVKFKFVPSQIGLRRSRLRDQLPPHALRQLFESDYATRVCPTMRRPPEICFISEGDRR